MSSERYRKDALDAAYRTGSRRRKVRGLVKEEGQVQFRPARAHRGSRGESICQCARGASLCGEQELTDTVDEMLGLSSRLPDDQLVSAFLSISTGDHLMASRFDREMRCAFANLQFLGQPFTNKYERDWQKQCNEKLQECAVLICLLGRVTHGSTAIAWEVGRAIELAKPVIPISLHTINVQIPEILRSNSMHVLSLYNFLEQSDVFARTYGLTR